MRIRSYLYNFLKFLFILILLTLTQGSNPDWVSAEDGGREESSPIAKLHTIVLKKAEIETKQGIQVPFDQNITTSTKSATFDISYMPSGSIDFTNQTTCSTFPPDAITAFNYAAGIWASTISSSVPITIRACWGDLGLTSTLGYSASYSFINFSGAPLTNTWYSSSLANSFHGSDISSSVYDIYITYNKNFDWYFGTDAITPTGKMDFVTVAAHEIAHGLNFSGTAILDNGIFTLGWDDYPNIYDRFIYTGGGLPIINLMNSSDLGEYLTSNDLWFQGANAMSGNGDSRVKIYSPDPWKPGSSFSHLDYTTFSGSENSLMVYAIPSGTSIHNPGPVTIGILKDLGWQGALSVPSGVFASNGTDDTQVIISWNPSTNADHYEILRNTSNSLVGESTIVFNDSASPYNDLTATPGTLYYYWVKACNEINCSDYSIPDSGWIDAGYLTAPTSVSASDGLFTDKISIFWNETGGANYYKIYRNTDISGEEGDLLFDNLIGNSFDDISVTTTEDYYYWVKACDNSTCSGFSLTDQGNLKSTKISAPINVNASDGTYFDKIYITWDSVPGITYYQVFRNSINSVFGSKLIKDNLTVNYFDDTTFSLGTEYFYWLKACNNIECSVFSNPDSGYLKQLILDNDIFLPLVVK